jgi:hypothetical protein
MVSLGGRETIDSKKSFDNKKIVHVKAKKSNHHCKTPLSSSQASTYQQEELSLKTASMPHAGGYIFVVTQ